MKTPAPERAAGRRKLAARGQALPGGQEPIPDVPYLKKAIRSVGRLDPAKRPALKNLIIKRAKALGALNEPGVKGTWAFQGANEAEAVDLAMAMPERTPMVRDAGDVQMARTSPGVITVTHKPTGMKVGTITPKPPGWAAMHADGTKTPASGSQAGAMAGLIRYHNQMAAQKNAKAAAMAPGAGIASVKGYAGTSAKTIDLVGPGGYSHGWKFEGTRAQLLSHLAEHHASGNVRGRRVGPKNPTIAQLHEGHAEQHAMRSDLSHRHGPDGTVLFNTPQGWKPSTNLAGEQQALDLAMTVPANSSSDGPRMTVMAGGKPSPVMAKLNLSPEGAKVYAKLRKKGLGHGAAMAMAKRAASMHAKAAA